MHARLRPCRRPLVALLVLVLTACHSWRPTTISPTELIVEERPGAVRITRTNGSVVALEGPTIMADSIVGTTELGRIARAAPEDIRSIEVRRLSVPKTLGLVIAHLAVGLGIIVFATEVSPHYRGL